MTRRLLIALAASIPAVAAAMPCPGEQPRLFPSSGTEIAPGARIMILVRPENAVAIEALRRAKLALSGGGLAVPLRRDRAASAFRSARGERVLLYLPVHPLEAGVTYGLSGLPVLPPPWASLAQARWTVAAQGPPASLEFKAPALGRNQCAAFSADARVCRMTIEGKNDGQVPVLLQATIAGKEDRTRGPAHTFVDIVGPGEELALHSRACDAELGALRGGKYHATFVLKDASGHPGTPWKTEVDILDINEEMGRVPGVPDP